MTYNSLIKSFCERGMVNKAMPLLDEMLQSDVVPNVTSFDTLIKAFCKIADFSAAQRVFDAALSTCGQKEVLYSLMCSELSTYGRWLEAKNILETALDMRISIQNFPYKQLIEGLCKGGEVDHAHNLLKLLMGKHYSFDQAVFMPVIEALSESGKKQDAGALSEKLMEMTAHQYELNGGLSTSGDVISGSRKLARDNYAESDWRALLHRDDSARTVMKITKRVRTGWGQKGNFYEQKQPKNNDFDILENTG